MKFFRLILQLLLSFLVTSAVFADVFEEQTTVFVKNLSHMKMQQTHGVQQLAGYQPWLRPFVFVNRDDLSETMMINAICPAAWSCETEIVDGMIVSRGHAAAAFLLPLNLNYNFFFYNAEVSDPNVKEIFAANSSMKMLMLSIPPVLFPDMSAELKEFFAKPFGYLWFFLHESFHLYVEFAATVEAQAPWIPFPLETFLKAKRQHTDGCYDRNKFLVKSEIELARAIWMRLLRNDSVAHIKPMAKLFLHLRNARYRETPIYETTDCKTLDTVWERMEGLADYNSFQSLIDGKMGTLKDGFSYYDLVFYNDIAQAKMDTFFYISGSMQAFLLDRLDPEGKWRDRIVKDPSVSIGDLLKEAVQ